MNTGGVHGERLTEDLEERSNDSATIVEEDRSPKAALEDELNADGGGEG